MSSAPSLCLSVHGLGPDNISVTVNAGQTKLYLHMLLRSAQSPDSSLSVQDMASVCEGQDPLHLHVFCRQCWTDSFVSCSSEQDPSTNGSDDERILAGKLYVSSMDQTETNVF